MAYQINKNVCVGCGACASNCPVAAINQKEDKYDIDFNTCVSCGACVGSCPVNAIEQQ
ncbi:MAG: 4Fe-4S binding protein [Endomicrobium sp.]|nr:4Fe-4S binding protein [Endomicrobium sp.]